jgi:hypothetical protein
MLRDGTGGSVAGMNTSDRNGGKIMRRTLLPLAIVTVLVCVTAATSLAAGSTKVEQFSYTFPENVCGFSGTVAAHGTSAFGDTGNGTYFASGTWFGVFTADNGKSTTASFAEPQEQTSAPVIDEQAGTVTITTTYGGLFQKLSITGGPTLIRDAGIVTLIDVYEYTGDPTIRWVTSSPRRCLGYMGHLPIS